MLNDTCWELVGKTVQRKGANERDAEYGAPEMRFTVVDVAEGRRLVGYLNGLEEIVNAQDAGFTYEFERATMPRLTRALQEG